MDAKTSILDRISRANVPPSKSEDRAPVHVSSRTRTEIVDQFAAFAEEYRAQVTRLEEPEISRVIESRLASNPAISVVVPPDLPPAWVSASRVVTSDDSLDHQALDAMEAVITGCALAVAETGTVVLDSGKAQGRRAITLIPDHHICVVFEDQVVDSIPEAVAFLRESVLKGQPLTWISGPSATSDIELSRVEGVHGPRKLDILLVKRT